MIVGNKIQDQKHEAFSSLAIVVLYINTGSVFMRELYAKLTNDKVS